MEYEVKTRPQNSLILIMDRDNGIIPLSMNGKLIAVDKSCIAIGTLSDIDGKTKIVLTNETPTLSEQHNLVYSGMIDIPNMKISVCNILDENLIDMDVEKVCNILIYANHELEPDSIIVVVKSKLK
jgi:hypothetical protein